MLNEPNGSWSSCNDWNKYKAAVKNLKYVFDNTPISGTKVQAERISDLVQIIGPDNSGDNYWISNSVDQIPEIFGAYDTHWYAEASDVKNGHVESTMKYYREYINNYDPNGKNKPFIMGEAGLVTGKTADDSQPNVFEYWYGVSMADFIVQTMRAGMDAITAWMLEDSMHLRKTDLVRNVTGDHSNPEDLAIDYGFKVWGMWNSKGPEMAEKGLISHEEGQRLLALRPWYFAWALFSRSFVKGSKIVRTSDTNINGVRTVAAIVPKGGDLYDISIAVVNNSGSSRTIKVKVPNVTGSATFQKYSYFEDTCPRTIEECIESVEVIENLNLNTGYELTLPADGFVILTTVNDDRLGDNGTPVTLTKNAKPAAEGIVILTPYDVSSVSVMRELQLIAKIMPDGAEGTIKWSVTPSDRATIDHTGRLKPIKTGNVKVEAYLEEEPGIKAIKNISIVPTFVDEIKDFSNMYSYSGLDLDSSNAGNYFNGDDTRVKTEDGYLIYEVPGVTTFDAIIGFENKSAEDNLTIINEAYSVSVTTADSIDGAVWVNVPLKTGPVIATNDGWHISNVTNAEALPEGTRFVRIDMKVPPYSGINPWSIQLLKVTFEAPDSAQYKEEILIDDELDNFDKMYGYYNLVIDGDPKEQEFGDTSRLKKGWQGDANMIYEAENISDFSINVFFENKPEKSGIEDLEEFFDASCKVSVSPDNENWTEIATGHTEFAKYVDWTTFYHTTITPAQAIPGGMRYLRIDLPQVGNAEEWNFMLARVVIRGLVSDNQYTEVTLIDDELLTFDKMHSYDNIWYDKDKENEFEGDASRIKKADSYNAWIVYEAENISDFSIKAFFENKTGMSNEELFEYAYKIFVSPDNNVWTSIALDHTEFAGIGPWGTWYSTSVTPAQAIPDGTRYLKIELPHIDGTDSWFNMLGRVVIRGMVQFVEVTGISLNKSELKIMEGQIDTSLKAFVEPENATIKEVAWSSSNPSVATVDAAGKIKALRPGNAVITATTSDGGLQAKCDITVVADNYVNLAKGKTVSRSSSSDGNTAERAVDGDPETRWGSGFTHDEWFQVDLGTEQTFRIVRIDWESSYGVKYDIQVSNDGENWTTVFTETNGNGGTDLIVLEPVTARYIRMQGYQAAAEWGYSIYEFAVYEEANLALNRDATASSEADGFAYEAVDGNLGTRWGSAYSEPQWLQVDLGRVYDHVQRVVIHWEASYGKDYRIDISTDGTTWNTVSEITGSDGGIDEITFEPVAARFIRMYGTRKSNEWGFSIWEFQVYETPAGKSGEIVSKFIVTPHGGLVREANAIKAAVTVAPNSEVPAYGGNAVVVFQFMKGNTPIAIVSGEVITDSANTYEAELHDIHDFTSTVYTVRVFVLDELCDGNKAPVALSNFLELK